MRHCHRPATIISSVWHSTGGEGETQGRSCAGNPTRHPPAPHASLGGPSFVAVPRGRSAPSRAAVTPMIKNATASPTASLITSMTPAATRARNATISSRRGCPSCGGDRCRRVHNTITAAAHPKTVAAATRSCCASPEPHPIAYIFVCSFRHAGGAARTAPESPSGLLTPTIGAARPAPTPPSGVSPAHLSRDPGGCWPRVARAPEGAVYFDRRICLRKNTRPAMSPTAARMICWGRPEADAVIMHHSCLWCSEHARTGRRAPGNDWRRQHGARNRSIFTSQVPS